MSRTSHKGFEHVQKFYAIFFAKTFANLSVVQLSYDVLASVENLSLQNFGTFTM